MKRSKIPLAKIKDENHARQILRCPSSGWNKRRAALQFFAANGLRPEDDKIIRRAEHERKEIARLNQFDDAAHEDDSELDCPDCGGTGFWPEANMRCESCDGSGMMFP